MKSRIVFVFLVLVLGIGSSTLVLAIFARRLRVWAEIPSSLSQTKTVSGAAANGQIPSLAVFGDHLYAGTQYYTGTTSVAHIWRTAGGAAWEKVDEHSANSAAAMIVYKNYLYAGSWGDYAQIWRSPDGITWTAVVTDGFGGLNGIARFAVYSDTLYAGTWGGPVGAQIWRTTDGDHWQQFGGNGFNNNPNNSGAPSSIEFGGYLYWGAGNWTTGAELWRTDGLSWTPSSPTVWATHKTRPSLHWRCSKAHCTLAYSMTTMSRCGALPTAWTGPGSPAARWAGRGPSMPTG